MVSEGALNHRSSRLTVEGFLLKAYGGYGCVQPWTEFGHVDLEQQWAAVRDGQRTALIDAALTCAKADGDARREEKSWWQGRTVPCSHATITDLATQAEWARDAGFSTWKVKASLANGADIIDCLQRDPELRLRLDFNEVPQCEEMVKWIAMVPQELLARIDFLEDPFAYEVDAWRHFSEATGIRLAQDRSFPIDHDPAVALAVWKPAWTHWPAHLPKENGLVTSAMDHPVGQAWAAFQASAFAGDVLCGLRTDHLFARDAFTERMGVWSPQWPMLAGTGMGFDDLLEHVPWTRLR